MPVAETKEVLNGSAWADLPVKLTSRVGRGRLDVVAEVPRAVETIRLLKRSSLTADFGGRTRPLQEPCAALEGRVFSRSVKAQANGISGRILRRSDLMLA